MKKLTAFVFLVSLFGLAIAESSGKNSTRPYTFDDFMRDDLIVPPQPTPPTPVKNKAKLGIIDKWRYESCQQDAGSAATPQGVILKKRVCDEKFDQ
jgi:hypothetical protein